MNTIPYTQTMREQNLLRDLPRSMLNRWVSDSLETTIARMGQRLALQNDPVLLQAITDFIEIIVPMISHYSTHETAEILRLGALGELGDNVAMSSRTVAGWVRTYNAQYRPNVIKAYNESQKANQKTLPEPEPVQWTRDEAIEHLHEVYEDYHNGDLYHARSYDIAVKFDLMPEKYRSLDRFQLKAKVEVGAMSSQGLMRGQVSMNQYNDIVTNASEGTPLLQAMKREALAHWFDFMKLGKGFNITTNEQTKPV